MLSPIQNTGDHSPELQIANAPGYMNDANGHIVAGSYADFAQMSANLVRYYNTGGFDDAGNPRAEPPRPTRWRGGASSTSPTGMG